MPDESCRNCGDELKKCTLCAECKGAISMICVSCATRTTEQVHALCFMPEIPKVEESAPLPSRIFKKQLLVA